VEGSVKYAEASLEGHSLIVIDSSVKHDFAFTPAMSLFLDCESQAELDTAFEKLSAHGQIFMPLNNYGSARGSDGALIASAFPGSSISREVSPHESGRIAPTR
jgi:predicted 3-demethylubiquinone-9 3-methyltransferase (glyoxalase superfamily)